jgi:hypothetical protein
MDVREMLMAAHPDAVWLVEIDAQCSDDQHWAVKTWRDFRG